MDGKPSLISLVCYRCGCARQRGCGSGCRGWWRGGRDRTGCQGCWPGPPWCCATAGRGAPRCTSSAPPTPSWPGSPSSPATLPGIQRRPSGGAEQFARHRTHLEQHPVKGMMQDKRKYPRLAGPVLPFNSAHRHKEQPRPVTCSRVLWEAANLARAKATSITISGADVLENKLILACFPHITPDEDANIQSMTGLKLLRARSGLR